MTINATAATALAAAYQTQLVRSLGSSLRIHFPSHTGAIPQQDLDASVRHARDKCSRYGVDQELDIRRFLELTVLYGANFDSEQPWASRILAQAHLSGHERMRQIDEYELFALRGGPR